MTNSQPKMGSTVFLILDDISGTSSGSILRAPGRLQAPVKLRVSIDIPNDFFVISFPNNIWERSGLPTRSESAPFRR
jgi:hypothetical protein